MSGPIIIMKANLLNSKIVTARKRAEDAMLSGVLFGLAETENDAAENTVQGRSLARFKIVDDYLDAVDSY